jgi:hypothetical protein
VAIACFYWLFRHLLGLAVLRCRSDAANEVEILVLRQELAVVRRQVGRPSCRPADRMFLAALVRMLPRDRWGGVFVRPETIRCQRDSPGPSRARRTRTRLRTHRRQCDHRRPRPRPVIIDCGLGRHCPRGQEGSRRTAARRSGVDSPRLAQSLAHASRSYPGITPSAGTSRNAPEAS